MKIANTISPHHATENLLGNYLRNRRTQLDPPALGFFSPRRRTPGLQREEVAQRAKISTAWYTWLEQGRGGSPLPDLLDRIAHALMLTDVEREHLYLLGLGTPPNTHFPKYETVMPRLQRVLNALDPNPALIKLETGEVALWNRAVTVMLTDFESLPAQQRNISRLFFQNPAAHAAGPDGESVAPTDKLGRLSPAFKLMWRDNDVGGVHGGAIQHINHPRLGQIDFEYSAFAVHGRSGLSMVVSFPSHWRTPPDSDLHWSLSNSKAN
jgi:transcriptional regulator with XRE-family HTH domain